MIRVVYENLFIFSYQWTSGRQKYMSDVNRVQMRYILSVNFLANVPTIFESGRLKIMGRQT